MTNKITKIPQIRFNDFTEDWEQRKLGEVLIERNEQTPESIEYPLMSFVQGVGVTPKGDRYDRSFLVKDEQKKYKRTQLGDFIYSSNNLETGSIGFNNLGNAVISPVYSIFYSENAISSKFIGINSTKKIFINKMIKFRQGVVYGQWRIHEKDFLNIDLFIPCEKEQTAILNFFTKIDETITLHQDAIQRQQDLKKAMLQKLFPINGGTIPTVRFSPFTEEWEQRKLGDMVEFFSGLTYSPDNVIKQPGTLVLRSSNVQNGEIVNADNVYVDNEVVNSDNVQVGDIAVVVRNGSRSLIGKHAAIKYPMKDTVIGAFMTGVRSDTPSFTNALLDTQQFETEIAKNLGATINQITTGNFKKMMFNFPEIDERLRIGDFFKQLDDTIALHQQALDELKLLKQRLLQKMFV